MANKLKEIQVFVPLMDKATAKASVGYIFPRLAFSEQTPLTNEREKAILGLFALMSKQTHQSASTQTLVDQLKQLMATDRE